MEHRFRRIQPDKENGTVREGAIRRYAGKTRRKSRMDTVTITALLCALLCLWMRIPLAAIIGDRGIGFVSGANEIFLVVTLLTSYGMNRATASLIKYRIKREQYRNAMRVLHMALLIAGALSLTAGILLSVLADFWTSIFLLEPLGYMAVAVMAPAIFLSSVTGVLTGYFQGMGSAVPALHSRIAVTVVYLVTGLFFAVLFTSYGEKVSALLKDEEFASAYGAMGNMAGLLAAGILGLIHMLCIYGLSLAVRKRQLKRDESRSTETKGRIGKLLVITALPYAFGTIVYSLNALVDQRIFNYTMNIRGLGEQRAQLWGVYYGKYMAFAGGSAVACSLLIVPMLPLIGAAFVREEPRLAKERLGTAIHTLILWTVPWAVLLAALAQPLVELLCGPDNAVAARLVGMGTAVVALFPLTFLFTGILQRLRKMKFVIGSGLIAFLLHAATLAALLKFTKLGIEAVVIAGIVFLAAAAGLNFLAIVKLLSYQQEWVRTLALPLAAAGVMGFLITLLNRALYSLLGAPGTLVICLVLGIVLYLVLLLALKGVTEQQLNRMPFGRGLLRAAKLFRLM